MVSTQENAVDLHSVGRVLDTCDEGRAKHVGKIHHRTDHKSPEEEQRYSSTLSLTSALGWLVKASPQLFYCREREPVLIV